MAEIKKMKILRCDALRFRKITDFWYRQKLFWPKSFLNPDSDPEFTTAEGTWSGVTEYTKPFHFSWDLYYFLLQAKMEEHIERVNSFHSHLSTETIWLTECERSLKNLKQPSKIFDQTIVQLAQLKVDHNRLYIHSSIHI